MFFGLFKQQQKALQPQPRHYGDVPNEAAMLRVSQLLVLQSIHKCPGQTYGDLERRFKLTNAAVVRAVNRWQQDGLCVITRDPQDTSITRFQVEITEKGIAYVRVIANALACSI